MAQTIWDASEECCTSSVCLLMFFTALSSLSAMDGSFNGTTHPPHPSRWSNNQISHSEPDRAHSELWIYALPLLELLDLSENQFSGEISEFKTTPLTRLSLGENQLQGVIPKSIFRQPNLMKLDLSSNSLKGTFALGGISMLKKFNSLDLCSADLSSLT